MSKRRKETYILLRLIKYDQARSPLVQDSVEHLVENHLAQSVA